MPNRILREGILESDAVNALTPRAEVFYRRLMSVVDDFGRFDGRAAILRGRLYPLQLEMVSVADITQWLEECCNQNLIATYIHNGKPYIMLGKLGSPRAKDSKFPQPPADVEARLHARADANICAQTHASVPYSYSGSYSGSGSGKEPADEPPDFSPAPDVSSASQKPKTEANGIVAQAVELWRDLWARKYQADYPYSKGKENKHLDWMLEQRGRNLESLGEVFRRYLACDEQFFFDAKHPLGMLRQNFQKWIIDDSAAPGISSTAPKAKTKKESIEEVIARERKKIDDRSKSATAEPQTGSNK